MIIAAFLLAVLSPSAFAAAPTPPFEAEVTSSSGPVQLTFRVHHTTLTWGDAPTPDGSAPLFGRDGLFFQIEIKNIGKEPFTVFDPIFGDGSRQSAGIALQKGILLEVRDSSGNIVEPYFHVWSGCRSPHIAEGSKVEEPSPEVQRQIDQWRKEGVPGSEIQARLHPSLHIQRTMAAKWKEWKAMGLSQAEMDRREARLTKELIEKYKGFGRLPPPDFEATLQPGQSVVTPPWSSTDCNEGLRDLIPPHPPFTEAEGYTFKLLRWKKSTLGRYTIRAIFENRINPEHYRELKKMGFRMDPYPDQVRVETDPIPFRVVLP